MSIVDSQVDRAAAEGKVAVADVAELERDLVYWSVTSREHQHEHEDLADRQAVVRVQWQEAAIWVALITDELSRRRGRRSA